MDVVSANEKILGLNNTRSLATVEIATSRTVDQDISDEYPVERDDEGDATIDHFYEEVGSADSPNGRYEILDYRDKHRRENSKTFVNNLSTGYKICARCARSRGSPVVYSDRLIHGRKTIYAREATLFNPGLSARELYFKYRCSTGDFAVVNELAMISGELVGDYMPVLNLTKAGSPGILSFPSAHRDVFDLGTELEPCVSLLNGSSNADQSNTRVYHRSANQHYSRVSTIGRQQPMIFRRIKSNRKFSTIKSIGCDENTINWMDYDYDMRTERSLAKGDEDQSPSIVQHNRSSLLLLEPLLLMPEITSTRKNLAKNRITHSEHVKIVRMVIAYTLSFFLLAIITFYIVYFT